ncbi:DUF192 domain-containing protein [Candidatus Woesearchaeota archaeon]|nr:MAG: DUF192 domain-containing protein [Candidatus Woesearchaeota archaeon]
MRVLNASRKTVLAESVEECRSFWEQTRGMMFRREVVPLMFTFQKPQTVHLHSWFCPGVMDLVFLDDSWEVVELHSEWAPRRSYRSRQDALILLELPAGTIAHSRTAVGDQVHLVK